MNTSLKFLFKCMPAVGCGGIFCTLLMGSSLQAQEAPTIVKRSPFVPTNFNPGIGGAATNPSQAAAAGYEFRGVYQIGDRYWFLVSEPKSRDGSWIELGSNAENVEARRYDPESKSLTVFSNNTELTLQLADIEANPKPIPVQGLVKPTTRTPTATPTPVRRTIRPTTGTATTVQPKSPQKNTAPPPAWLEKLRSEAAERRAQAGVDTGGNSANPQRRTITPRRPDQQSQGTSGQQKTQNPDKSRSR